MFKKLVTIFTPSKSSDSSSPSISDSQVLSSASPPSNTDLTVYNSSLPDSVCVCELPLCLCYQSIQYTEILLEFLPLTIASIVLSSLGLFSNVSAFPLSVREKWEKRPAQSFSQPTQEVVTSRSKKFFAGTFKETMILELLLPHCVIAPLCSLVLSYVTETVPHGLNAEKQEFIKNLDLTKDMHPQIYKAVISGNFPAVRLLLDAKADVNTKQESFVLSQKTLLHVACIRAWSAEADVFGQIAHLLLLFGAEPQETAFEEAPPVLQARLRKFVLDNRSKQAVVVHS